MNAAMVKCGGCGVGLSLAQADVAGDGYRCLSCSMDETQAARIAGDNADIERMNALKKLRVSLYGGLFLVVLFAYSDGATRWGAAAALLGLAAFTFDNVRRLLR